MCSTEHLVIVFLCSTSFYLFLVICVSPVSRIHNFYWHSYLFLFFLLCHLMSSHFSFNSRSIRPQLCRNGLFLYVFFIRVTWWINGLNDLFFESVDKSKNYVDNTVRNCMQLIRCLNLLWISMATPPCCDVPCEFFWNITFPEFRVLHCLPGNRVLLTPFHIA